MGKKDKGILPGYTMITVTIFRSVVDDSKETLRLENPIKVKEVFPDTDFSNSIISVNGALQDSEYLLVDGDICTIRLFPEGSGKDWLAGAGIGFSGAMGALSLLSLLNIWNPVGWVGAVVLLGGAIAGAVGFGIASAAGWSVVDWLNGSAADMKSPDKLDGIPQLRGARNQSNYGKPVPLVLGRHLLTPMYVGNPYSTISGEDGEFQYFHALYMLGYRRLSVRDVKLGIIGDLASNRTNIPDGYLTFDGAEWLGNQEKPGDPDNPVLELVQSPRECVLYPEVVVEEPLNIELTYPKGAKPLDVVRFTAKNPRKVQIEIALPGGLIGYNDKGDKKDAEVKISVRWRISKPDQYYPADGGWNTNFGQFGAGQNDISYDGIVTTITRKKTKTMRFVAEHEFSFHSQVADEYDTRVIELEIKRANEQPEDTKISDKVYLTAIRTWLFDNEESKKGIGKLVPQVPVIPRLRDRTARLAVKIKATGNTQGYLDALNCIVEPRCRTWNSATKKWSDSDWDVDKQQFVSDMETATSNPAALALKLLQSPSLGKHGYKDDMIDMESFGEFYEWCAERKYNCNGILTATKRLDEVLALVLSTGRAMRVLNGGKYGLLIDKPRDYPVMVLNSQNVLEASNQKGFDNVPDGFLARYINEEDGYQYTEEYVMAEGANTLPTMDSLIETLELPFITNHAQAVKAAWYNLACRKLRPEIWNRKVSVDGYLVSIGDMVEIQDDTISVGIGEGGIIQALSITNNVITKLHTDGNFEVADMAKSYGLKIMQADGVNNIKIRTVQVSIPAPGLINDFEVYIPLSDTVVPQEGDIVAFGIYDRITTPAICFGKKENGDGTFDLTFVPYQEGVYNTDTSKPIPPYNAFITTPQRLPPPPSDTVTKGEVVEIAKEFGAGEPASMYRLMPSAVIIRRYMDGVTIPDTVSCGQVLITGSNTPIASKKTIKYKTNTTNGEVLYTGPLAVMDSWEYVNFYLYDGDTLLDFEEIPVLSEGSMAVVLDVNPDLETLIYEYDGTPVPGQLPLAIKATLYKGLTEISNSVLGQNIVKLYPGHGDQVFTPLGNARYPVSTALDWRIQWSLENQPQGVSIDDEGEITVAVNAKLAVRNEITAVAVYEGQRYAKRFLICVVTNGAPGPAGRDAMFIDLSNEHISLIAKTDGTLYTHPAITSQAMLFLGATELLEGVAWSINPAVANVSISAQGLVTIAAAYTQTVDRAEVNVHAEYHDQTYMVVLTIYRVKDGPDGTPAVVYHLHPSASAVKRNAAGTPDPSSITCKVFRITGASPPAEDQTKTIKYTTSANATENTLNYNGSINIPAAQTGGLTWIKLMLYDGSTLLDGPETIPIVQDGQPGQKGDKGDTGVAKYLGKTVTTTNTSSVVIKYTDTYSLTVTANVGDWVAYVGTSLAGTSPWQKYYCLQWRGTQEGWVKLDPLSSEFTSHYMEALGDITDGAPTGVFSTVLVNKILALQIFADRIETQLIKMRGPLGAIQSDNYDGVKGWQINYAGNAYFMNGIFRGRLEADSGYFKGELQAATGTFAGALSAATGSFAGSLTANSITLTGTHTAGASATAASNPKVIAHDNNNLTDSINISLPITGGRTNARKRLRIAGTGSCRFHLNIRGRWSIERMASNGSFAAAINSTDTSSTSELWTGIVDLPDDINIFYLFLDTYGSNTRYNTIFEAVTSTSPGLFKYMSSPL
jgi:hypothetical protein